jgi:hypothetical protein
VKPVTTSKIEGKIILLVGFSISESATPETPTEEAGDQVQLIYNNIQACTVTKADTMPTHNDQ